MGLMHYIKHALAKEARPYHKINNRLGITDMYVDMFKGLDPRPVGHNIYGYRHPIRKFGEMRDAEGVQGGVLVGPGGFGGFPGRANLGMGDIAFGDEITPTMAMRAHLKVHGKRPEMTPLEQHQNALLDAAKKAQAERRAEMGKKMFGLFEDDQFLHTSDEPGFVPKNWKEQYAKGLITDEDAKLFARRENEQLGIPPRETERPMSTEEYVNSVRSKQAGFQAKIPWKRRWKPGGPLRAAEGDFPFRGPHGTQFKSQATAEQVWRHYFRKDQPGVRIGQRTFQTSNLPPGYNIDAIRTASRRGSRHAEHVFPRKIEVEGSPLEREFQRFNAAHDLTEAHNLAYDIQEHNLGYGPYDDGAWDSVGELHKKAFEGHPALHYDAIVPNSMQWWKPHNKLIRGSEAVNLRQKLNKNPRFRGIRKEAEREADRGVAFGRGYELRAGDKKMEWMKDTKGKDTPVYRTRPNLQDRRVTRKEAKEAFKAHKRSEFGMRSKGGHRSLWRYGHEAGPN